jgi:hypothetical protein
VCLLKVHVLEALSLVWQCKCDRTFKKWGLMPGNQVVGVLPGMGLLGVLKRISGYKVKPPPRLSYFGT